MSNFPFEIPHSPIFGKAVGVAGTLEHFPEPEGFCQLLEHYGGRRSASVTEDTAFLVCNDITVPTSDVAEAQKRNIPILSERDFFTLIARGCGSEQDQTLFIIEDGVLVKYTGNQPDVVIPEGVRAIGPKSFYGCHGLRSVAMAEGICSIEELAFAECNNLQGICLPTTLLRIASGAFHQCSSLLYADLPEGLETIEKEAFYRAGNLQSLVIPSTVTEVGQEAFFACFQLKSLTIRHGVQHIGRSAFSFCQRLTSLTIPEGTVPDVGSFSNCRKLQSVTLPPTMTEIPHSLFSGCDSLQDPVIPAGVKTIGICAFEDCGSLQSITLPAELTTIENAAFRGSGLRTVTIPANVTTIGTNAFRGSQLRSVFIEEGVCAIGDLVFFECEQLETVILPLSLRKLGNNAFHHCQSLRNITIPETVGEVPEDVFYGCNAMADDNGFLVVGSKLISAFLEGCTQLVIPEGITSIRNFALFDTDDLQTVIVPSGVTDLGDHFLERLPELRTVILPSTVTTLAHYSIYRCNELRLLQAPGLSAELLQSQWLTVPAALGYLCCPEAYTDPETIAFYRKCTASRREDILPIVLEEDWVGAIATYGAMGQITEQNFDTQFLQPALAANATKCLFFLMDWKNSHLAPQQPEVPRFELDTDVFNESDMQMLWQATEYEGGLVILSYRGQEHRILVPPRFGAKPVHQIGPFAFSPQNEILKKPQKQVLRNLKEVRILPGIIRIGTAAFFACPQLERVILPATVQAINTQAFADCPRLILQVPAGSYAETYAKENNIPFVTE